MFVVDFDERTVAPLAVGKADKLFGVVAIGESGRIAMIVGNAVLNPAQSGRIQITDPGSLNRRWASRYACSKPRNEAGPTRQVFT